MQSLLLTIILVSILISCIIPMALPNCTILWIYFFILSILSYWLSYEIMEATEGRGFMGIIIAGLIPYITLMSTIIRTIILLLNKPSKIEK